MSIKQLSVYLENKKGSLSDITTLLAENKIDLRSMSLADTKDFGIVRILSPEVEKAYEILKNEGHTAKIREIVGFAVPDEVGGLAKALEILDSADVNIEYMYAMLTDELGKAYVAARVDDNEKTEKLLRENGITVLND